MFAFEHNHLHTCVYHYVQISDGEQSTTDYSSLSSEDEHNGPAITSIENETSGRYIKV